MPEKPAGKVEHYYPKVKAAAVRLTKKVKVGDEVHIVGHGDDFKEEVTSLQLDHQPIQEGQPGQSVGLWVKERVHEGDDVLLVTPDKAKPSKKAAGKPKAKPKAKKASAKKSKRSKAAKPKARKAAGKPKKAKKAKPSKGRKAKPARKAVRKRR